MSRLQTTDGLTEEQHELIKLVREFVNEQIIPVATALEHKDEYPTDIVEGMKEMGIFGLMIPEEYGGLGESLLTYALVVEEIARGWMSVSGIINTHFIVAYLILQHGTEEQKQRYLPRMATGEVRGAFSMSEPGLGSDVAAIRTKAVREGDEWVHHRPEDVADQRRLGQPRRGARAHRPRRERQPLQEHDDLPHRQDVRLRRDGPGRHGARQDREDGLQGRRHHRADLRGAPHHRRAGARRGAGKGFYQMMDGVEVGRVNVAARACGLSMRAFELGIAYSQQRETFGKKIAEHQGILFRLADMATMVEASHQMMVKAARLKDAGERNDLEAGMAKYLASENCANVVEQSFRIHGGYGYSKEYEIERLYREAPMLLIGEGTAEIQKMIIGRRLLEDYKAK